MQLTTYTLCRLYSISLNCLYQTEVIINIKVKCLRVLSVNKIFVLNVLMILNYYALRTSIYEMQLNLISPV